MGVDTAAIPLESTVVVVCVVAVAVLAVGVLAGGWTRWPGPGRAVSLLVAVVAVVAAGGVLVNRAGGFYPTLGALTATSPGFAPVARMPVRTGRGRLTTLHPGHGLRDVEAYLPAAYADPALAQALFPTVVWTGGPLSASPLPDRLDAAIDGDRLPPVVVLAAPGGQVRGLRAVAGSVLRLRPDPDAWAVLGPATGGRCPIDAALRAPGDYTAAAGRACRELPRDAHPLHVLATALADRPDDVGAARRTAGAATRSVPVGVEVFPAGTGPGDVLDEELQWLGPHLAGPVVTGEGGGRREPA